MAISIVQSAVAAGFLANVTATFSAPPTSGNIVLAFSNSDNVFTISGSPTRRFHYLSDQQFDIHEYTGTLPTSVTVTPAFADWTSLVIVEISGSSGFNSVGASFNATGVSSIPANAIGAGAGDMVFVATGIHGAAGTPGSISFNSGFTLVDAAINSGSGSPNTSMLVGSHIQPASGSSGVTTSWSPAADNVATAQISYSATSNVAPTANAGTDQTVDAGVAVTLDGTGSSDSDGTVSSYAWAQSTGPAVTLSSASAAQPTFTAPVDVVGQTLGFSLTVTDNNGASSTPDTVMVAVRAAPSVRVWDGSSWQVVPVKTWSGSAWGP